MIKTVGVLITFLLLFIIAGPTNADQPEQIDFDIFRQDSLMTVWVDLSPLLTSRRVEQLQDGIDIAVEYQLSLLRPKRLWGSARIEQVTSIFHVGYRVLTQDYFFSRPYSDPPAENRFLSLGDLHKFLVDSVTVNLALIDSLDANKRYYIRMELTCVSLTSLNLADESDSTGGDQSPVRWLFKRFLDLTNFGRQDYALESRLFSLSELTPRR